MTYVILINFPDNIFKKNISHVMFCTSLLKFINCNITTSVLVKISECCNKMFLTLQFVEMNCCSNKLPIIYSSTVVHIGLKQLKHFSSTEDNQNLLNMNISPWFSISHFDVVHRCPISTIKMTSYQQAQN
ncbi:calcium-dependent protein kinase [Trifolium repens]|nr:calcium-dependent protein kinase [Trifolium repens]